MNGRKTKLISLALATILSVAMLGTEANAATAGQNEDEISISEARGRNERALSLKTVITKNVSYYASRSLYVQGKRISTPARIINGEEYISLKAVSESIGASYSYSSSQRTATVRMSGLLLTAGDACYTSYANDRPQFSMTPNLFMSDGGMYIPARVFAKVTGLSLRTGSGAIYLSGNLRPLKSAGSFYRSDEVFWLARIIQAESAGEPLIGKIAVGNVVLNRVRSSSYPNTIYGVIFDRKYGVQFSPVLDGSIYNTPSYNATLAAKICLEGFDLSEGALFFLRPEMSSSSWIPNNRPYIFSIGKHDFYK